MRRPVLILAVLVGIAALIAIGGGGFVLWQRAKQAEADAFLAEARAEMQAGRIDEAARFFGLYLASRRNDDAVRREYADLLLEKIKAGKLTERGNASAFKLLEQVVRENPDDHWLRFQLAKFQVQIRQFTSALEHLELLRKACPAGGSLGRADTPGKLIPRHEIDALLGEAFVKTGQFREAVDVLCGVVGFDRATRRFADEPTAPDTAGGKPPPSPATFQQLANLLEQELGDEQAAGLVIARNTVVNATDPAAWITLAGRKYLHDKDLPAALEAVKKATEIAPEDSAVMSANFQIAMYGQNLDDAAKIAARGLELHPDQEWPYSSMATLALRAGDVTGTIDPLVTGLRKAGPRPALLQMLVDLPDDPAWNAALASRLDDVDSMLAKEERYRAVLAGRGLMTRGKWLEAACRLETARPLAVELPALQVAADLALATCHERLGDSDLQLAAAQRAILGNPKSTEARAALAKGLLVTGQARAALDDFRLVASALKPEDLARRSDIWGPLMRLERAAIERDWPNSRISKEIDALRTSLEKTIPADRKRLLEAEDLSGSGKIHDAISVLDEARRMLPDDASFAAAAIALRARSAKTAEVIDFFVGLPPSVRESEEVLLAAADACRILPAFTAERVGDILYDTHPTDLNAAMTALESRLRRGKLKAAREATRRVNTIAGHKNSHSLYAAAAIWALEKRLAASRLPRSERDEGIPIRKMLSEVELQRPDWPELHCRFAEIDLLEGRSEQAIARYRRALANRPSDPHIARTLIGLLMRAQRYAEAEKALAGLEPAVVERLGRTAAELRMRAGKRDEALAIASRATQTGCDDPDELLWFAEFLARNGRTQDAAAALDRGVALAPERVDLWLALADHQATSKGSGTAAETISRAHDHVPEACRGLLRAERERRTAGAEHAVGMFRELVQQLPEDLFLLRRATECCTAAGIPEEARMMLDSMLKIRPQSSIDEEARRWSIRRRAETMLREGTFPMAEQAVDLLLKNSGGDGTCTPEDTDLAARLLAQRPEPRSWRLASEMLGSLAKKQPLTVSQKVLVARLLERLGGGRTARNDLLDLALQPDVPVEVYAALVEVLLGQGDFQKADMWLGELRSKAPDAPETITLQALLARARGDKQAAAAAAKRLMPDHDVTPETITADLATAATLEGLGFPKAAERVLTLAAAASPEGVVARGGFLLRQKRIDEAAEAIAEARAGQDSPQLTLLEAELLEAKNRHAEAEEVYRTLLAQENIPAAQRVQATASLALCLIDRNESKEALDLLDHELLKQGPHPDLLDARALARFASGNKEAAIQDLAELALAPTPVRLLHIAHTLCLIGDEGNARGHIERAVRLGLDPASLRSGDRQRFEHIVRRLGLQFR